MPPEQGGIVHLTNFDTEPHLNALILALFGCPSSDVTHCKAS